MKSVETLCEKLRRRVLPCSLYEKKPAQPLTIDLGKLLNVLRHANCSRVKAITSHLPIGS